MDSKYDLRYGRKRHDFWAGLVPKDIAHRQVSWERKVEAWRMRQHGLTFKEMGARLFVNPARAHVLFVMADRLRSRSLQKHGRWISPVEHWSSNAAESVAAYLPDTRREAA